MAENASAAKEEVIPSAEKRVSDAPKQPILLIIIAVLNMVIMGVVAMVVYKTFKAEQAKPKLQDIVAGEVQDQQKKDEEANDEEYVGKLVPLETFLVNLAGSHGNKLVKINMEMEVDSPKVEEEIDKRKAQIRDIIIILLSSKTYEQVTTKEGKEFLRDEIRDTVNSFLVKGKIKKVYFTDFIVN